MIRCLLLVGSLLAGQVENSGRRKVEKRRSPAGPPTRRPGTGPARGRRGRTLKRGPAILDLLPPPNDRQSAEVRQRLGRVRQKLQQQAADNAARSSTMTLHADAMPLSKILAAFSASVGQCDRRLPRKVRSQPGRPIPR